MPANNRRDRSNDEHGNDEHGAVPLVNPGDESGVPMLADTLSRFNFGELMGFLAVGGGLLIALVAIVGGYWTEIRKIEISAALKQDMLSRGMSADEIQTVLEAGTDRSKRSDSCGAECA